MTNGLSKPIMKRCPKGHDKPEADFIGAKGQPVKYCKDCRDKVKERQTKRKTKKPPPGMKICTNNNHHANIELFEGDHKCCTPCLKKRNEALALRRALAQAEAEKEGKRYCGRCDKTKEIGEFKDDNCTCKTCIADVAEKKKGRYDMNLKELKEGNKVCTYCSDQHPLDHFDGADGEKTKRCQGCRDKKSTWWKRKYSEDERYKIMYLLRESIRRIFNNVMKDEHTMEMIGCDLDNVMNWLYFQLEKRYGITEKDENTEYHIDHSMPVKSFDLKDPEERKKCSHWTNLEWLTQKENNEKRATMPTKKEIKRRQELIDEFKQFINNEDE